MQSERNPVCPQNIRGVPSPKTIPRECGVPNPKSIPRESLDPEYPPLNPGVPSTECFFSENFWSAQPRVSPENPWIAQAYEHPTKP